MKPLTFASVVFLFSGSIVANASGSLQSRTKAYADENIRFSYPADRYSHVEKGDNFQDGSYSYLFRIKGIESEDIVTVCDDSLQKCATNNGGKPYWYGEDGTLMLFSATTSVKKRVGKAGETLHEAFPACPATDREGSSVIGGDCYELVSSTKSKTISITYSIGPTSFRHSRSQAANAATRILRSIEFK